MTPKMSVLAARKTLGLIRGRPMIMLLGISIRTKGMKKIHKQVLYPLAGMCRPFSRPSILALATAGGQSVIPELLKAK
jgi:hypothetical protein